MVGHVSAVTHQVASTLAKTQCCTDARLSPRDFERTMQGRCQRLGHSKNHNAKYDRLARTLPASVTGVFQKHQDFRIEAADWFLSLQSPHTTHCLCAKTLRRRKKTIPISMPVHEGMIWGSSEVCNSTGSLSHSAAVLERWRREMQRQKVRVLAAGEDAGGSSSDSEIPATSDEFLRKVSSESYTNLSKQMQEKEEASFEGLWLLLALIPLLID